MKNQKFNIKRFGTYAKYNLTMNSRLYLTQLGSVALVIFFILFFPMLKNHSFQSPQWGISMMVSGGITLLIFISNAFPALRKKETQMNYFMEPASILEKFTFEFVLRYVGFLFLFPVLFFLMGKLVYPIVEVIRVLRGSDMLHVEPISSFNLYEYFDYAFGMVVVFGIAILLVVMSLIFAGTVVFKKNPLLKTVGFVLGLMALVGYYFYVLYGYLEIGPPAFLKHFKSVEELQSIDLIIIITSVLLIITVLSYAFYKLKEKEV